MASIAMAASVGNVMLPVRRAMGRPTTTAFPVRLACFSSATPSPALTTAPMATTNSEITATVSKADIACHPECVTCNGPGSNQCASCGVGNLFTPDLQTCTINCSIGFYELQSECLACDDSCQSCNGPNSFDCLTCPPGLKYVNGKAECLAACPSDFYSLGMQCLECDTSCTTCSGKTAFDCSSCTLPLMHNPTLGSCEPPCSDGFYNDGVKCAPCDPTCATCSGSGITNCLSCAGLLGLSPNSQCVADCGNKYYNLNGICQRKIFHSLACDESCLSCKGPGLSDCLSCESPLNHVPDLGVCLDPCPPDGFYPNGAQCLACNS